MVEGEKRRFWIPAELAYGENPGGGRPGGQLTFDVELISIKQAPKPPEDTEKTASGIAYKVLTKGSGEAKPKPSDLITFHFSGQTMDGQKMQDTTGGTPPTLALNSTGMPDPMRECLADMVAGEKRRCWIPEPLIPGGFVVADLELLSIKKAQPAPPVPENVAAAPANAEKTASGLASKVITAGTGKDKPKASDTVSVHYTGWMTNGKMFDSSVTRGAPTQFPLSGVIKGWTEGLQLMVTGEKRRFWIPADLAYGENPVGGRPGGMLVFDIELLEINP
jgi:FKBP-type peptidyl-prolyl cis-trans isomerase